MRICQRELGAAPSAELDFVANCKSPTDPLADRLKMIAPPTSFGFVDVILNAMPVPKPFVEVGFLIKSGKFVELFIPAKLSAGDSTCNLALGAVVPIPTLPVTICVPTTFNEYAPDVPATQAGGVSEAVPPLISIP